MSGQQSQSQQQQRMRKTVSPGAGSKQGPIRAIVPLSLMQTCSPTRCLKTTASPSNSPPVTWASGDAASKVKTRLSPDNRISPSESSQSPSPICRGKCSILSQKLCNIASFVVVEQTTFGFFEKRIRGDRLVKNLPKYFA